MSKQMILHLFTYGHKGFERLNPVCWLYVAAVSQRDGTSKPGYSALRPASCGLALVVRPL
jgi:hypothetical protein